MIKYLKEEAKRAKKAGLTKSQFVIAELILLVGECLACASIFITIFISIIFFG